MKAEHRLADLLHGAAAPLFHQFREVVGERPLVVYGAGDGYITFSTFVLEKYGLTPALVLDVRFTMPMTLNGVPAIAPAHFMTLGVDERASLLRDAIVVVTVGKSSLHEEILATLQFLGFKNVVLAFDIYEYHLSHAPAGFEVDGPGTLRERAEEIEDACRLLADQRSKDVFIEVLRTYLMRAVAPVPHETLEEQYFPRDIELSRGPHRLINCGSYDGDTVRRLLRRVGKISALACFEPDAANFSRLTNFLALNRGDVADEVVAFPCGVWSREAMMRFAGGQRINCTLSQEGSVTIQCVALDHVIPDFRPTYINMDVESAELEALRGARELIEANKPDLAICVYHRPEHIFEIPMHVHSLGLGYRLYLRNYTGFPAETVLYATI